MMLIGPDDGNTLNELEMNELDLRVKKLERKFSTIF